MIFEESRALFEAELAKADVARAAGNEGMARVCARRAAGIALRAFFIDHGLPVPSTSAMDLLEQLRSDPGFAPEIRAVADHLLQRVNPEYQLPIQADLLAETRWLISALQDGTYPSSALPRT